MTAVDTRPPEAPAPNPTPSGSDDGRGSGLTFEVLAVVSMVVAMASILIAIFAVGLASRAIDEHRSTPAAGGGGGAAAVAMSDFEFAPSSVSAAPGGSIAVSNDGPSVHNLIVEDVDGVGTADLNVGDSATLDLGALEAGTYTIYCSIPGHRESGMEGTITIG